MTSDRVPGLVELARSLEMRWRLLLLGERVTDAATVSLGVSLLVLLADAVFALELPVYRALLVVNGTAIIVALVRVALHRRELSRFLIDADRAYGLKSLLVSGFEFADVAVDDETHRPDSPRRAFEAIVVERAEEKSVKIEPQKVYPRQAPRRVGIVAALVAVVGIMLVLGASGWFDRPEPPFAAEMLALEDAGRRLADRAEENEELRRLAEELQQLGEQARSETMDPQETRRRIEQLNERIEQQVRNLERTPPLEYNEDAEIPPEAEETVRGALRSGMSDAEVIEFFTRMRSEGNTVPDIVDALEEATPDQAPNANLGIDEERLRELMDQLNRQPRESNAESDIVNDLEESQRVLQQMGSGLAELSEGEDLETGAAGENQRGVGRGGPPEPGEETGSDDASDESESSGQQGGTMAMDDSATDDFRPAEQTSPVFREIEGIVTDNTIMDIIIRELPSEATSGLSEQERDVVFERVIEEAVNREETPPELQRLVRNYFLRLTFANREGAEDEQ